jgi:hypothetical protein
VTGFLALRQRAAVVRVDLELGVVDKADQARLADLRRQLAAVQAAQHQAEKEIAQLAQAAVAQPVGGGAEAVRTVHTSDIVKDHPEYAAILAKQARRNMLRQYGGALDSLNLRPDQLAKLKDLLVERSLSSQDAFQAAKAAGLEQGSPAWSDAMKAATEPVEKEMSAVVGTDSGQFMRKLQTEAGISSQIRYNYTPDFQEAGVALTANQTNSLRQALAGAYNNNGIPASDRATYRKVDPATGLSPADSRMLEAAAQTLTPAQLQVLQAGQIRQNQQSAIFQQYLTGSTRGYRIMP